MLTKEEEFLLIKKYQEEGDSESLEILFNNFSPMIKKNIRKRSETSTYDKDDLMQQCFLAMVDCLSKFDLSKDNRLSSYYKFYLKQYLSHFTLNMHQHIALDSSNLTKLALRKNFSESDEFKQLSKKNRDYILSIQNMNDSNFLEISSVEIEDTRTPQMDIISDIEKKKIVEMLYKNLNTIQFSEREIEFLREYSQYDEVGFVKMIAEKHNITSQRSSQILMKALEKARKILESKNLSYKNIF